MNRIENKKMAAGAAKLFEQEVLELEADVPRKELCDMVDDYIFYQTDGISREEAHTLVDKICREAAGKSVLPAIAPKERDIAVDENGFLIRLEDWTEAIGRKLAAREGIQVLTEDKLDILRFMRQYYLKHAFFPIVRSICKTVGQQKNCLTQTFTDPVTAWKIAGLPNPGEEVRTFQSWEPLGF